MTTTSPGTRIAALAIAVTLLLSTKVCRATQIANGGFETAGVGGALDSDEWAEFASGTALSERTTTNPRTGAAAHHFFTDQQFDVMSLDQFPGSLNAAMPSLSPGDDVAFEFWVDGITVTPNLIARLTVTDNVSFGLEEQLIPFVDTIFGSYQKFDTTLNPITIPLDAIAPIIASVTFEYTNPAPNGVIQEIWFDDVSLIVTPIPEPASGALAGLGLVGLLAYAWRRRRRA